MLTWLIDVDLLVVLLIIHKKYREVKKLQCIENDSYLCGSSSLNAHMLTNSCIVSDINCVPVVFISIFLLLKPYFKYNFKNQVVCSTSITYNILATNSVREPVSMVKMLNSAFVLDFN